MKKDMHRKKRAATLALAAASLILAVSNAGAQPTAYGPPIDLDGDPPALGASILGAKPVVAMGAAGAATAAWLTFVSGTGQIVLTRGLSGANAFRDAPAVMMERAVAPALATLPGGRGLVVYWADVPGATSNLQLLAHPVDPLGRPTEDAVRIDDPGLDSFSDQPAIAALPGDRFAVAWVEGTTEEIDVRLLDLSGAPLGAIQRAEEDAFSRVQEPDLAAADDGSFLVAWEADTGSAAAETDIRGRRFDSSGSPVAAEFLVNEITGGFQLDAAVLATSAGDFLVAWSSEATPGDPSFEGVSMRRFSDTGRALTAELRVNQGVEGVQASPVLARARPESVLAAWLERKDDVVSVRARVLDADGAPVGHELRVDDGSDLRRIAVDLAGAADAGGYLLAWDEQAPDDFAFGPLLRRVSDTPPIFRDGFENDDLEAWDEVLP